MINYNNHNSIKQITYNNHSIKYVYGCGGNLVWSGGTGPTPPTGTYRMKIKKIDDSEVYSYCDGAYSGWDTIYQNEVKGTVGSTDIFEALNSISSIDFGGCPSLSAASFGAGAYRNTSITSVTFTDTSIKHLGTGCFGLYESLESIVIPDSITSMGSDVFGGSGLRSVTIGSGLTELSENTFYGTQLRNVTIPSGINKIGNNAFTNCSSLTSVTIEGNDVELGDGVFAHCTALRSFDFSNIKKIGSSAFTYATTLSSVTIPSSVTYIGNEVFRDCSNIKTATIESSVTSINRYMFANCTSLSAITLPSSVRTIDEGAFSGCTSLSEFNQPNITTYVTNAFDGCANLTSVNLASATTIGNGAFRDTNLSIVNLPNVESIGNYAFRSSGLTDVTIGEYCLSIGNNTFYSVNIPNSALTITCLAEVPPTVSGNLVNYSSLNVIYVPDASVDTYKSASGWSNYADRIKPISEKP